MPSSSCKIEQQNTAFSFFYKTMTKSIGETFFRFVSHVLLHHFARHDNDDGHTKGTNVFQVNESSLSYFFFLPSILLFFGKMYTHSILTTQKKTRALIIITTTLRVTSQSLRQATCLLTQFQATFSNIITIMASCVLSKNFDSTIHDAKYCTAEGE